MTKGFNLNRRAHQWIDGFRGQFVGRPLVPRIPSSAFKML